ncbi:MAG: hypothetical protein MH252_16885 [Thermosynechococcaceae cyanobacterium MS004]|nr:hypothetical protein [Thermosynechococcaceae cyanobacterium MS004]
MAQATYSAPVNALLSLGETQLKKWPDYLKQFNWEAADIPELIRMATDLELNWADSDSLEVWAPAHAWRSLGQLRAEAAIKPLVSIFNAMEDCDWFREEMPEVFGLIGPSGIAEAAQFLANPDNLFSSRWMSAEILVKIGQQHPSSRAECLSVLVEQLNRYSKNSLELNGAIICAIIHLEGIEAAPSIEAAFSAKRVDTSIPGDWVDVQYALGLATRAETFALRRHVDAEHLESKATKLRGSTVGFGQSPKASKKGKKK